MLILAYWRETCACLQAQEAEQVISMQSPFLMFDIGLFHF